MNDAALLATLAPPSRLALAYAAKPTRADWLVLLAFDERIGGIVRRAREPLLGQVRLAWWRDRLREEPASWPAGEPLLAALRGWAGELDALARLVDAWEAMLGDHPDAALPALAEARAEALVMLARRLGADHAAEAVRLAGRSWVLAELGTIAPPARVRLPREMRPLAVLLALANRPRGGPLALLAAMRTGLLGR